VVQDYVAGVAEPLDANGIAASVTVLSDTAVGSVAAVDAYSAYHYGGDPIATGLHYVALQHDWPDFFWQSNSLAS